MFDGNELVVLNGWLICGKPRKKKKWWDLKHMLYDEMRNWAMWNCAKWLILKKMPRKGKDWYWKRCPERENDWYEKKCPNGKRMWWERWKMVYLLLIFLFRQLNELSILIEIVWIGVMNGEYIEMMEYVVYG